MNWGGFSSGLANGFQNGVKMGKTYRDLVKEYGLQKLREEQLAKAKKDSTDKAGSLVTETPPAATPASQTPPAKDNTTPSGNTPVPVQREPLPPMQSEAHPSQPAATPAPAEPAPVSALEPAPAAMEVTQIEPPENALSSANVWWNNDA